jgi:ABC-2 type transporter.
MKRYLKLLRTHTYYQLIELLRQPMYVLSTLVFPAMFFWFFGVPNATTLSAAKLLTASFSCFAILGVVLFQFAIGIAQDKGTPWSHYLRILPLPGSLSLLPRVLNSLLMSFAAVACVVLVSLATTVLTVGEIPWVGFIMPLLCGAVVFSLLGSALGYASSGKAVIPAANLIYLPLSFAGGLWLPPSALPKAVQTISEYLPTRFFGELVWAGILNQEIKASHSVGLAVYGVIFLITTWVLFKKFQGQEFR